MTPKDEAAPASAGGVESKALTPYSSVTASAAKTRSIVRFAVPAAFALLAGAAGFLGGAYATGGWAASQREASVALVAEARAQAAALSTLAERVKALEEAPRADAVVRPAIDILARRVDEIARTQTGALTQTRSRFERAEADMNQKIDKVTERLDRLEKQVSAAAPVGSIPSNASSAARQASPGDGPVRGYVLREVFRDGGALVEGRHGLVEVFPGAELPGAGRVRGVERRDGRWVVVTSAGVIETHR